MTDWGAAEPVRELLNTLRPGARLYADRVGSALRPVLANGSWRDWVHPVVGPKHFDTFDDFIEAETKFKVPVVIATLQSDDADWTDVLEEIAMNRRDQIGPANDPENNRVSNTNPQKRQDRAAAIARLKRDRPDLAVQVVSGDLTPHAALVRAGIRHPRAYIRTDDVGKAVDVLLRHYDKNEILEVLS